MHIRLLNNNYSEYRARKGDVFEVLATTSGDSLYLIDVQLGAGFSSETKPQSPRYDSKKHQDGGYGWIRSDACELVEPTTNTEAKNLLDVEY